MRLRGAVWRGKAGFEPRFQKWLPWRPLALIQQTPESQFQGHRQKPSTETIDNSILTRRTTKKTAPLTALKRGKKSYLTCNTIKMATRVLESRFERMSVNDENDPGDGSKYLKSKVL